MSEASLALLRGRLELLLTRVRAAVESRRATDPQPDDAFRGLYISDEQVDDLLLMPRTSIAPQTAEPPTAQATSPEPDRLRDLADRFGLDEQDIAILLVSLAPDLDPRFEKLYGYLQDDVSRRRASIGLAVELARAGVERLHRSSRLVAGGLVEIEENERPLFTRSLRVPDRVLFFLLGDDRPDPLIEGLIYEPALARVGDTTAMIEALAAGEDLIYIKQHRGGTGVTKAASALRAVGMGALAIDLERLDPGADHARIASIAAREARARGAGLIAGPVDAISDTATIRRWTSLPCLVVLTGARNVDPLWTDDGIMVFEGEAPTEIERAHLWSSVLNGSAPGIDPAVVTTPFTLSPEQITRAADLALRVARAQGRSPTEGDVAIAARAQNDPSLERLAHRIEPRAQWDELVLPRATVDRLRELAGRVRHRARVYEDWGFARSTRAAGVACLFAGDSGTGKTLSAEVIAGELGLDLYRIDLSGVISKYIGETEKNLRQLFDAAEDANAVLLFDEADALFGKRSEVKDSHDRYANVEIAYLLQRMELFDGLAILTTNLGANVDEAFARRLTAVVNFRMPDEEQRRALWTRHIGARAPCDADVDIDFLARAFRISGGNIRNVAVAAAFFAAHEARAIAMADLIKGVEREYEKLGRLCVPSEFGPYYDLVSGSAAPAP